MTTTSGVVQMATVFSIPTQGQIILCKHTVWGLMFLVCKWWWETTVLMTTGMKDLGYVQLILKPNCVCLISRLQLSLTKEHKDGCVFWMSSDLCLRLNYKGIIECISIWTITSLKWYQRLNREQLSSCLSLVIWGVSKELNGHATSKRMGD